MDVVPVQEVAAMLAELAEESPPSLLHACRRLIEYYPASGRLWWLSARALSAPDPVEGIWEAAGELLEDPTAKELAKALPPGTSVNALGAVSKAVVEVMRGRRAPPQSKAQKKAQGNAQGNAQGKKPKGPGGRGRVTLVSALAAGPTGLLVHAGAARRVLVLAGGGATVWGVVPRGTLLPGPLWEQLLARTGAIGGTQVVAPDVFSALAGPNGLADAAELLSAPACPPVAELLGWRS